jgi:hypothetical protein
MEPPADSLTTPGCGYGEVNEGKSPSFPLCGQLLRYRRYEALPPGGIGPQGIAVGEADQLFIGPCSGDAEGGIASKPCESLAERCLFVIWPLVRGF